MDKHALFQQFVAFTAAVHQISDEMTRDVKVDAITTVQYKMLEYLAVSQPVTLSEISQCMHMSMPNTSRELKKLTEKRLCEKANDAADRRKQLIRLSASGQAMMNEVFDRIEAKLFLRLQAMSEEELQEIGKAMELLQSKVFHVK